MIYDLTIYNLLFNSLVMRKVKTVYDSGSFK